jgi:RNA recognition motif-containing protein
LIWVLFRGFCFLEFESRKDAEKAKTNMNGKIVCGRNLVVHFAEEKVVYKSDAPVEELLKSALTPAGQASSGEGSSGTSILAPSSSSAAIVSALRAKLAQMERE